MSRLVVFDINLPRASLPQGYSRVEVCRLLDLIFFYSFSVFRDNDCSNLSVEALESFLFNEFSQARLDYTLLRKAQEIALQMALILQSNGLFYTVLDGYNNITHFEYRLDRYVLNGIDSENITITVTLSN